MGINGLLPKLRGITNKIHISKYAGQKVAVDGHVWLHAAAYGCAKDLALGLPTTRYLYKFTRMVGMLRFYKVEPIIVFDGQSLLQKRHISEQREANRNLAMEEGFAFWHNGDIENAENSFQKAIKITPQMIHAVIKHLDTLKVQHIVAPYEADPQLTYLVKTGQVSAVITVDSDLLTFGCSKVIFKMDEQGNADEIEYKNICAHLDDNPSPNHKYIAKHRKKNFDPELFRWMCIMAGCDYLPPLPTFNMDKAQDFVELNTTKQEIIKEIYISHSRFTSLPYIQEFYKADAAFLYQFVFDMNTRTYCRLNPLPANFEMADVEKLGTSPQNQDIPLLRSNHAIYLDRDAITRSSNKENIDPNAPAVQSTSTSTRINSTTTTTAPKASAAEASAAATAGNASLRSSSISTNQQKTNIKRPLGSVDQNMKPTSSSSNAIKDPWGSQYAEFRKRAAKSNENMKESLLYNTSKKNYPFGHIFNKKAHSPINSKQQKSVYHTLNKTKKTAQQNPVLGANKSPSKSPARSPIENKLAQKPKTTSLDASVEVANTPSKLDDDFDDFDDFDEEALVKLAETVEAKSAPPSPEALRSSSKLSNAAVVDDNKKVAAAAAPPPQSLSSQQQLNDLFDDDISDSQLVHLTEQVEAEVLPVTREIHVAMPDNEEMTLQVTTCKLDSTYKIYGVAYNPTTMNTKASPPATHVDHGMSVQDMASLIFKCMEGDQDAIKTREAQLKREDRLKRKREHEDVVPPKEALYNVRKHMTLQDVSWHLPQKKRKVYNPVPTINRKKLHKY